MICEDPLNPLNIEWITNEISKCEESCDHIPPPPGYVPTRLIEVGVEGVREPRLVLGKSLRENIPSLDTPKYATLSYCWGSKEDAAQQLKTTASNIDSYYTRIPEDELTPVIRDTIRVCRAVNIKYLWVDALCIIQGDLADWNRESESMGRVYYHSYLTICPLSSSSCLEGFLQPRPPTVNIHFQSTIHDHIQGLFGLYESHNDADLGQPGRTFRVVPPFEVEERLSQWSTRGWTHQEGRFAYRTLSFGKSMLHFSCETEVVSECGFQGRGLGWLSGDKGLLELEYSGDHSQETKYTASNLWQAVTYICSLQFTYATDLLPSISGIAKACASVLEDTYMAGIWKSNLHYELGTSNVGLSPRRPLKTFPRFFLFHCVC